MTPGALQHPVFGLCFAALKIELGLGLRIAHRHGIALRLPPLPRLWHQGVAQCIDSAGYVRKALLKPPHCVNVFVDAVIQACAPLAGARLAGGRGQDWSGGHASRGLGRGPP